MNKLKIAFLFTLLIFLIISIGSVSAENVDLTDNPSLSDDINEDVSLNDNILGDSKLNDNDKINNVLLSNGPEEDSLGANDLDDKISADDSEIAENIKVNFSNVVYQNDTGNITVELPDDASGYLVATIDGEEIYNQSISEKTFKIPIVLPKPKFPYLVVNRDADCSIHNLSIFYNDISLDFNHTLKVMKYKY